MRKHGTFPRGIFTVPGEKAQAAKSGQDVVPIDAGLAPGGGLAALAGALAGLSRAPLAKPTAKRVEKENDK